MKSQKDKKLTAASIKKDKKATTKESANKTSEDKTTKMIIIMDAYHSGDKSKRQWAVDQMYQEIQGFIGHMIKKYFGAFASEHYHDLYNEGIIAVMENMENFDPCKGTLTTYFTYPVMHAMSGYVNSLTNKSTPYYSGIMNRIRQCLAYYEKIERNPSITDIALYTGLSIKKVEEGMKRINAANEVHYSSEAELDSILSEQSRNPEEIILENEQLAALDKALLRLDDLDRWMVQLRFGFVGKPLSFAAIAQETGLPINQVNSRISRSLRKLRESPEMSALGGDSGIRKKKDAVLKRRVEIASPEDDITDFYAAIAGNNPDEMPLTQSEPDPNDQEQEDDKDYIIRF